MGMGFDEACQEELHGRAGGQAGAVGSGGQLTLECEARHQEGVEVVKESAVFILTVQWPGMGKWSELDEAIASTKKLAVGAVEAAEGGWAAGGAAAWAAEARVLARLLDQGATARAKVAKEEGVKGWNEWVDQSLEGGAGPMHRLTAIQRPWVPHTVMWDGLGEGPTALPEHVLESATAELRSYWRASDIKPDRAGLAGARHMPPLEPMEILGAARTFGRKTSSSLDGVHPRRVAMLSVAGLQ
eukprot:6096671-Lingulodinium_polyedra.AAC.1